MPPRTKLAPEQIDELCGRFAAGASSRDLAADYGIALRTVKSYLRSRGVTKETRAALSTGGLSGEMDPATEASYYAGLEDAKGGDPLGDLEWLHRALIATARQVIADPAYNGQPARRRKELRDIATAVGKIVSPSALADAKRLISADSDDLEKTKVGPTTVKRATRKRR